MIFKHDENHDIRVSVEITDPDGNNVGAEIQVIKDGNTASPFFTHSLNDLDPEVIGDTDAYTFTIPTPPMGDYEFIISAIDDVVEAGLGTAPSQTASETVINSLPAATLITPGPNTNIIAAGTDYTIEVFAEDSSRFDDIVDVKIYQVGTPGNLIATVTDSSAAGQIFRPTVSAFSPGTYSFYAVATD